MENQHRKITGYRELSQGEIDLMNRIKEYAVKVEALAHDVADHIDAQNKAAILADDNEDSIRLGRAGPLRWLAIARTDFQTGFMALTRAVAQPTTF